MRKIKEEQSGQDKRESCCIVVWFDTLLPKAQKEEIVSYYKLDGRIPFLFFAN